MPTFRPCPPLPQDGARHSADAAWRVLFFTAMDAVVKGLVGGYPAIQVVWARFTGQFVIVHRHPVGAGRPDPTRCAPGFPGCTSRALPSSSARPGSISVGLGLCRVWPRRRRSPISARSSSRWARRCSWARKLGPRRILGVLAAMIGRADHHPPRPRRVHPCGAPAARLRRLLRGLRPYHPRASARMKVPGPR